METIKAIFWKPDPAAQLRKCNGLIRSNVRSLDRDIAALKQTEAKTKTLILQAARRAQRNPAQAKQAAQDTRVFARELVRVRKQAARLATSKAQLESVGMQVREAFSVRKIEGSIRASTGIMRDVNTLVRLPQLTGTMRELSQELVKAGIIEEMVGDSLPDDALAEGEDDEAEAEVDKILGEVLQGQLGKAAPAPADERRVAQPQAGVVAAGPARVGAGPAAAVEEDDDQEAAELTLEEMRGRLEALKS